jgi:hypothetical protein
MGMSKTTKSRSDSDAQTSTFTGQPNGRLASPMEIRFIPTIDPVLPVVTDPEPVREVWPGKGYELARKVWIDLGTEATQPGKFTAGLVAACLHYKPKKGRPFTVKSLREGLRNKMNETSGYLSGVAGS